MFLIAVCDDNQNIVQSLTHKISEIISLYFPEQEVKIDTFLSGRELLNQSKTTGYHVVFLDYDMPGLSGIEVGKKLRETDPDCILIMATAMTECINESFKIHADRFLLKPFKEDEIREAIQMSVGRFQKAKGNVCIKAYHKRLEQQIPIFSIMEIKGTYGMTDLYTTEGEFHRSESLVRIMQEINHDDFIQIRRNHVVNMYYVSRTGNSYYINNKQLEIPAKKEQEFLKKYIEMNIRKGI